MIVITNLVVGSFLFLLSMAFHEVGHKVKAESYGLNAEINFFKKGELFTLITPLPNNYQQLNILINGVVYGLGIALLNVLLVDVFGVLFLVMYAFGCRDDIKKIRVLRKEGF